MSHSTTSRVQQYIGDPVTEQAPVAREKLEEIFQDIQGDLRFDHELNGCLNCGICTATCPAAHYYDFSPREIVQLLWTENLEGIHDAMQEKIWSCAQCYTCAARCPFGNSPGGLIMLMRETAIKRLKKRSDFRTHLLAYLLVNVLVWVIWVVVGAGFPWPVFVTGGWGVGLLMDAWETYGRRPVTEQDVQAEMQRLKR